MHLVAPLRDLRVPLRRPRPRRPGVPQTPRREVAPCASHSCPWPRSPSSLAACGGSALVERRLRPATRPAAHHQPTSPPRAPARATPYDGVTYEDPGHQPDHRPRRGPGLDLRDGRRHRLVRDRPALRRRRQPARSRRASASRNGSTPSTRAIRRPTDATFARPRRRRPDARSSTHATSCCGSASRPASRPSGTRPDAALTFVIDTSGLDGPRGPPRAGQGLAAQARPRPRARRFDRGRHLRRRRPGRPAADPGDRRRDRSWPPSTSSSRAARPTSRPASRLGYELARETLLERRHRPGRSWPRTASPTSA